MRGSLSTISERFQHLFCVNLDGLTGFVRIERRLLQLVATPAATRPTQNTALQVKGQKM
jgi:hypothetical protein